MTSEPMRDRRPTLDPDLAAVRAAQRDREAFGALYRRYLDRVYGYCFYQLGDHHDAEDATERTFLAALGAIGRYRDEGATFRAWLFRIAHNQIANALRARGRQRTTSLDSVREPATGDDPAGVVGLAEDGRRLRRALDGLAEDRRQVVVLRFVDGLSAREIGAVLDRSEGAIRVLQHRTLRQLAEALEG
ncbi:MAG TPA: sigma-70 family RNA polymerase sigma factor [Candidatus Binatia bacterium]|nr:sigma-70 family RNA polymerase sigma factor [Candidatus Binatia bacterium]